MKTLTASGNGNGNEQRNCILWGRYSSDPQGDGDSRARQERLNRACAIRHGYNVIAEHFDEGTSVKEGATPMFKKVVAELPYGVGILAENLDRISRGQPFRTLAYIADILDAGHFIRTSQDDRLYTADSIKELETMVIGSMQSIVAYAENSKRIKRVREAKQAAIDLARKGKPAPLGGWLPRHLRYNPETGQYVTNDEIKAVYQRIFSEYAQGLGTSNIARRLNNDRIPTFGTKKIGAWTQSSICVILRYEGVIGTLIIRGETMPNAFPPAIKEYLFYKVQKMLEQNRGTVKRDADGEPVKVETKRKGKDGKPIKLPVMVNGRHGNYTSGRVNNILRGLCHCSQCGSNMKIFKHSYLGCTGYRFGRHVDGTDKACDVKTIIPWPKIEQAFAAWFIPSVKEALLGKEDSSTSIDTLETKKSALETKITQTLGFLDEGMPVDKVRERLAKLEAERRQVDNEIATAKAQQTTKATIPNAIKTLEAMIDRIGEDQEIRAKVAAAIPTLVKDIRVDLSDRHNPAFHCVLADGFQIGWAFDRKADKGMELTYFGKATQWNKHGYTFSPSRLPKSE